LARVAAEARARSGARTKHGLHGEEVWSHSGPMGRLICGMAAGRRVAGASRGVCL
jgi:hypothetical protein